MKAFPAGVVIDTAEIAVLRDAAVDGAKWAQSVIAGCPNEFRHKPGNRILMRNWRESRKRYLRIAGKLGNALETALRQKGTIL